MRNLPYDDFVYLGQLLESVLKLWHETCHKSVMIWSQRVWCWFIHLKWISLWKVTCEDEYSVGDNNYRFCTLYAHDMILRASSLDYLLFDIVFFFFFFFFHYVLAVSFQTPPFYVINLRIFLILFTHARKYIYIKVTIPSLHARPHASTEDIEK